MPQNPYVIYGTIVQNKVVQGNVDVTVRNVTKSQEATVKTSASGQFAVDLGDATKFAAGYSENDTIRVTALGVSRETTVTGTGSTPPTWGKNVGIAFDTFGIDVLYRKLGIKTGLVDVLYKKSGVQKSRGADMILKKTGIQKSRTADAIIKKNYTKTVGVDMIQKRPGTKFSSFDTVMKKNGMMISRTADIRLKKFGAEVQRQLDACTRKLNLLEQAGFDVRILKQNIQKTFGVDMILGAITVYYISKTADVLLKKAGVQRTVNMDINVRQTIFFQRTADAMFKKAFSRARTINVQIKKAGKTVTALLDTILFTGKQRSALADVFLKKNQAETSRALRSLFSRASVEKTAGLDAWFIAALTKMLTAYVDAMLKTELTKSNAADCVLSKSFENGKNADVLFTLVVAASRTVDVFVKKLDTSKSAGVDAWIGQYTQYYALKISVGDATPLEITAGDLSPLSIAVDDLEPLQIECGDV